MRVTRLQAVLASMNGLLAPYARMSRTRRASRRKGPAPPHARSVEEAIKLGATEVSNSYGSEEGEYENQEAYDQPGGRCSLPLTPTFSAKRHTRHGLVVCLSGEQLP